MYITLEYTCVGKDEQSRTHDEYILETCVPTTCPRTIRTREGGGWRRGGRETRKGGKGRKGGGGGALLVISERVTAIHLLLHILDIIFYVVY